MFRSNGAGASDAASAFRALRQLIDELPGVVSDRVHLFGLEVRRSSQALQQIVVFGVAAAILGATAWLALWACITGALIQAGLHWLLALVIVLLVNVGAAAYAALRIVALTHQIGVPATMRRLTVAPKVPVPIPAEEASTHAAS